MNRRVLAKSGGAQPNQEHVLQVIQEVVRETSKVRFEGDNYSSEWRDEAAKRGLPNYKTTPEALRVLKDEKVAAMLDDMGVMKKSETLSRYNVQIERFNKMRLIELETLLDLVTTNVLPASFEHQKMLAESAQKAKDLLGKSSSEQLKAIEQVGCLIDRVLALRTKLANFIDKANPEDHATPNSGSHEEALGKLLAEDGVKLMTEVREAANALETVVADELWTLPKYRELLYLY